MFYFFIISIVFLTLLIAIYRYFDQKIRTDFPENYPSAENIAKINPTKKVVVCFGDSNTHGNVSYDWVSDLRNELPDYQVFNAGINADLTYTLLMRIDEVVACKPDFVSILIGTNDVNFTMSVESEEHYKSKGKIGKNQTADFAGFEANLLEIISILKTKTTTKIALSSLPVMSEDLAHEANFRAQKYSDCIKQIAENQGLTYLPVREQQIDFIEKARAQNPNLIPKITFENATTAIALAKAKNLLGSSWNEIAAANGHALSTDNLHQNKTAGTMIKNLVKGFIIGT